MLTRRQFSRRLGAGLLTAAVAPQALLALQEERPVSCRATLINPDRLWESLMKLSEFGRPDSAGAGVEGSWAGRVGFSAEDLAGRHWLMGELEAQGLEVVVDAAANIRARRAGVIVVTSRPSKRICPLAGW